MRGDLFVLFCNDGYGLPFEAALRGWCARGPSRRFLVVKSLRHGTAPGDGGSLARLRLAVSNRLRILGGERTVLSENINDPRFAGSFLRARGRLFGVVAGFNQIARPETIRRFTALYNFHPSLLPYYRGPVPSYWCIRNKEACSGITLHEVTSEIDRGEIVWQESLPIETTDPEALDRALSGLGAAFLPLLLDSLEEGRALPGRRLQAETIYRTLVDYASFPGPREEASR
ncbi:MAG TPA: formyltransferase family protein [Candidatus Polarisedimenticolia bacterium]|nr:formyltransferase family protein [Candidatus Polarisedimenticolia bacterium]